MNNNAPWVLLKVEYSSFRDNCTHIKAFLSIFALLSSWLNLTENLN